MMIHPNNEEVPSEYRRYRLSDLGEVEEPYPVMDNERKEVDIPRVDEFNTTIDS